MNRGTEVSHLLQVSPILERDTNQNLSHWNQTRRQSMGVQRVAVASDAPRTGIMGRIKAAAGAVAIMSAKSRKRVDAL